jgi:hypothetical protein
LFRQPAAEIDFRSLGFASQKCPWVGLGSLLGKPFHLSYSVHHEKNLSVMAVLAFCLATILLDPSAVGFVRQL